MKDSCQRGLHEKSILCMNYEKIKDIMKQPNVD